MKEIFFSFFLLLSLANVLAQDPFYWQLTDEDGLPSMTVYRMLQDKKGYIWMGTANGLCRYDGKKFKYYGHSDQLDNEITSLQIDTFGRIWYANLSGQVYYLEKDSARVVFDSNPTDSFKVRDIYVYNSYLYVFRFCRSGIDEVCDPRIYVFKIKENSEAENLNNFPLVEINSKEVRAYSLEFYSNHVYYMEIDDDDDKLSLGKADEVMSPPSTLKLPFPLNLKLIVKSGTPKVRLFDENLYSVYWNNSYFIFNKKKYKEIKENSIVHNMYFFDGQIWILIKNNGIKLLDINSLEPAQHIFNDLTPNDVLKDKEGNFWIGTNEKGIYIIPSLGFRIMNVSNSSLPSDKIVAIEEDWHGKQLIIGDDSGNLMFVKDDKILKRIQLPSVSRITDIEPVNDKEYFVASDEDFISVELPQSFTFYNIYRPGFKAIVWDRQLNNMWAGNYAFTTKCPISELEKMKGNVTVGDVVLSKRTYAIHVDLNNRVWIGTVDGVYIYENDKIKSFSEGKDLFNYRVSSIAEAKSDSSIWIATNGDGLLQIKNDEIVGHFQEGNSILSNTCYDVFADDKGNIWIGTNKGLAFYDPESDSFDIVNRYDGLPSEEVTSVVAVNGLVYVGTPKGLAVFPDSLIRRNTVNPPIYITGVGIHEKDTILSSSYDLGYSQNSFVISFEGIGYRSRGDLKYRYRMIGIDTNWVMTISNEARFPAMMPGNYHFEVVAINEDGVFSEKPAVVAFKIHPPWWATWRFRISTGILIGGILWGGIHWRYRSIRNRENRERDFKEKINELRMQALQTQMNPHFIFNALNAIQHFLASNDQENAMIFLAKFARLIRLIFEQSKQKFITLEEELEFLKIYLDLEKLRFKEKVNILFEVTPEVEEQAPLIKVPPLLIQPIIENAFKHGLFHKEGQGELRIRFGYEAERLKCIVEDNGIGRLKSREFNEWRMKEHRSSGMVATLERLQLLKSDDRESNAADHLTITDLVHPNGTAAGTKVEVLI